MRIGIMSAMLEEIAALKEELTDITIEEIGNRKYYLGKLYGVDVVLVFSKYGKVASAIATTTLIVKYNIDQLIFTGVAGAVNQDLNIGDIVIANNLYQHDMDARPIFKQFEIPLTDNIFFPSDTVLVTKAELAAKKFISNIKESIQEEILLDFSITNPMVHIGKIASGDMFVTNQIKTQALLSQMPDVLAVEMEGAAVAQVCYDHHVPFVVIRTISDRADHNAIIDFKKFIVDIAKQYSKNIIKHFYQ